MIKYFILFITIAFTSCGYYPIVNVDEVNVCKKIEHKVYVGIEKKTPNPRMSPSVWFPCCDGNTGDTNYCCLMKQFYLYETTKYNDEIILTTNGRKYSVVSLRESKYLKGVKKEKYLKFLNTNKIDTSNLIILNCTFNNLDRTIR